MVDMRGWITRARYSVICSDFIREDANAKYISANPGEGYELKGESWYHLVFTYDGSRDRAGLAIYVSGRLVPTQGTGEDLEPLLSSVRNVSPLSLGRDKKAYFEPNWKGFKRGTAVGLLLEHASPAR